MARMKLKEVYDLAKEQNRPDVRRFMRDMKKAGIKIEFYQGRNFYHGPAAIVDSIQSVLSNTKVRCRYDNMGHRFVVHPAIGIHIPMSF